ncbi:RNA/RNP complex-1-interacting phosphatase-like isoform X2 [Heptranchias perlo]|uniref:RNA/RNP complex-1-interacting phosphatase-like isoform X2 n=1 Tax=Heptranchias perlo TaxID=212740 RepID=UPI00355968A4
MLLLDRGSRGPDSLPFKVPLKKLYDNRLLPTEIFSPTDLLRQIKEQSEDLGKIIDLTFTQRYYDSKELPEGLQYLKICTAGHEIPNAKIILSFKRAVKTFLSDNVDNDKLVGVHCTHGVNRTGYLICRYLIDVDGMDPHVAIDLFSKSRGYPIERQNYIEDLLQGPQRSNKGIDVSAQNPVTRQKGYCSQQTMYTRQDRPPSKGKFPTSNGFREFRQPVCPPRQSAFPYSSVQQPRGNWFGNGATHQTLPYNGQSEAYSKYSHGRQKSSWRNYQPESSPPSYQPESSPWSGQPESSRWSGQPESSPWSGQPESSPWSGQPESSRWSGQPESSPWSGQPESSPWSGQPESSRWSGQPESSRWSGQPESSRWSGQPESSRWSGQPESSRWSGQPESSRWSGQPESSPWSGQPESSPWSGQPESSPWSGQPESSRWSGQPESSPWSGQPESSPWSGQPESSPWSGQPESSPWSGQPESSRWSSQPESSPWSGQPESSRWSGQPESSRWSSQPPHDRRSNKGWKLNSQVRGRLNTHLRWDS